MESSMEYEQIGKKRSLKQRIIRTMVVCILIPFILMTIVFALQLNSNIDFFIEEAGGSDETLEALRVSLITVFIILAIVIIIVIYSGVLIVSQRITGPINELTQSIENMTEGDLTHEIAIEGKMRGNEIGILAQSFQSLLIIMRLGNKSYYSGDLTLAFKNYSSALDLFRTTKNLHGQGMCLNNLGNIYRNWADYNQAKECYDKSIELGEQEDDIGGLSPRYNNRALLYLSEEKWEDAMINFNKALAIDKELDDDEGIATRKRNIGVLHILKNEFNLAQQHLDEAFQLDSKWENNLGLAEDEFQLGRLAILKNNSEIAEKHLKNSLKFAEQLGNYPLMKNILESMILLYETQENTTLHHKAQQELSKVNDVLLGKKDVIFVIDQSGSMVEYGKMTAAREGALGVFNETINLGDRIAIIGFHSVTNTLLELTEKGGENIAEIINLFKNLDSKPYQTSLYDSIGAAIDIVVNTVNPRGKESQVRQKWIVTLTDGQDNMSKNYTPRKISRYIKTINPPLNFILIGVGPELKRIHRKMTEMVNATPRGKYITIYSVKNVQKRIAEAFKKVKEIMASSEIEGFIPEEG